MKRYEIIFAHNQQSCVEVVASADTNIEIIENMAWQKLLIGKSDYLSAGEYEVLDVQEFEIDEEEVEFDGLSMTVDFDEVLKEE